jgi:hypothetical protein
LHRRRVSCGEGLAPDRVDLILQLRQSCFRHCVASSLKTQQNYHIYNRRE